jgi:phenylalanyl-tRNA synthetase beta chain
VRGVTVAPSPLWLQQRLLAAGMRPINNVVDITNYVMLEYGQPLHAFDLNTLRGQRIVVRRARAGETMRTLDGLDRQLSNETLVIADAERAVAIAGVMGGAETEVTPASRDILLESASFLGASIRRTARRLGLRTEASVRFERNLSPELPIPALHRAAQLLAMLAGGAAAPGLIDVYPARRPIVSLSLTSEAARQLLGVEISLQRTAAILGNLGFVVQTQRESVQVTVPFWRSDIAEHADLIEEVARIEGSSGLPESLLGTAPFVPSLPAAAIATPAPGAAGPAGPPS